MEIKINGTIRIEEKANCEAPAENGNAQETQPLIDHSKDVLLDNAATFNELLRALARNPEVAITGQLEAEEQEREKREAKLREALGEDYAWVVEKNEIESDAEAGEMKVEKQKPKRRPGARQLREGYPRVAMIEIGKNARVEVFNNGYAIYDNGNRRVVLWTPDCGSAVYYFTGLRDNEKEYLSQKEEIGMDVLGDLPWYHALMIAGENRIEYNMDHPKSKGNTSDYDLEEAEVVHECPGRSGEPPLLPLLQDGIPHGGKIRGTNTPLRIEMSNQSQQRYTIISRNHCVFYASDITCYFSDSERICVLPKGKAPTKTEENSMNEKILRQVEEMKKQSFGIEIEGNNITREKAAKTAAEYFGTGRYEYTARRNGYESWSAWDAQGREWKFQKDVSIAGPDSQKCEAVSPILYYDDLELLQGLIRALRKAGMRSDYGRGCGVHVHIGGDGHTPQTIRNLVNIMAAHEGQLAKAIKIDRYRMSRYCRMVNPEFLAQVNSKKPKTMEQLEDIWYESQGESYGRTRHYNGSRYAMCNLHSFFNGHGTVEFRCFQYDTPHDGKLNGLHAGETKAFIQLCLAINQLAKQVRFASPKPQQTENEAYAFRCWMLRLGFIGEEFKTSRDYYLRNMEGNCAWRHAQ